MTKKEKMDKHELEKAKRQKAVDTLLDVQLNQIKNVIDIMEDVVWQLKDGGEVYVSALHRLEWEAADLRYYFNLPCKCGEENH